MKKTFYLTPLGYKVLSLCLCVCLSAITYCVIFLVDELNIFAIIFSIFVLLFCLFGSYLIFNSKIKIKNGFLIHSNLKTTKIALKEIIEIYASDEISTLNLIIIITKNKTYKLNGVIRSTNVFKNSGKTKELVDKIKTIVSTKKI